MCNLSCILGHVSSLFQRNDDKLGKQRLVKMARFVANGMQYLSQVGYVHRVSSECSQQSVCGQ